jgi:hypothetical protein
MAKRPKSAGRPKCRSCGGRLTVKDVTHVCKTCRETLRSTPAGAA